MSLSDQLNAPPPAGINGAPCSVGALYNSLHGEERAALYGMLWELGWSARRVHEAVTAEGHDVSWQQIGTHRRGQCRCAKDSK